MSQFQLKKQNYIPPNHEYLKSVLLAGDILCCYE